MRFGDGLCFELPRTSRVLSHSVLADNADGRHGKRDVVGRR